MKCLKILFTVLLPLSALFPPKVWALRPDALPASTAPLMIKALSPRYFSEGLDNAGGYIELIKSPDLPILSLTDFSLRYTNTSGKPSHIIKFPKGSQMVGETLLLRPSSNTSPRYSHLTYPKPLALDAGPLELFYKDTVVDSVCWKGSSCLPKFLSSKPTVIVRNLSSSSFSHQPDYHPTFIPNSYLPPSDLTLITLPAPSPQSPLTPSDPPALSQNQTSPPDSALGPSSSKSPNTAPSQNHSSSCEGLTISEILLYYNTQPSEQFIELYNPHPHQVSLNNCRLRYKKQVKDLSGDIPPLDYHLLRLDNFPLPKNPKNFHLELINNNQVISTASFSIPHSLGTSVSLFGKSWQKTYYPTPGAANLLLAEPPCPSPKIKNPKTGRCVLLPKSKTKLRVKTRNTCPNNKVLNPKTGRCVLMSKKSKQKTCPDGYALNPLTNRCRKQQKQNSGAEHPVVPVTGSYQTNFLAIFAVFALLALGLFYLIFQFRLEILSFFRRLYYKLFRRTKNKT